MRQCVVYLVLSCIAYKNITPSGTNVEFHRVICCLIFLLIPGDVVVHIFLPEQREFYNLEEFYGNATPVDLPFENQQFRHSKGF